ncbi:hypothetical protein [Halomicrobium salinisoli]|uniref:hypothetical protein n=1 Tax=Halomicrobium salinisoli TaxID=2878391 RepID=UPI001CF08716|nr:hypothetical protein [Halomicrobium salinisoli]
MANEELEIAVEADVDLTDDVLDSFAELVASEYGTITTNGFDAVDSVPVAEPPSEVTDGTTGSELSAAEQVSYAFSTLDALVRALVTDEESRFVVAIAVTSVVLPLIADDPDISSYEDVVARVYWALLLLSYLLDQQ